MADHENDPSGEPASSAPADTPAPDPQDSAAPADDTTPFDSPIMDSVQGSDDFPPPPGRKR